MPDASRRHSAAAADPARLDQLREFGFSPYASRAYVALLDLGEAEAREVARLARVPLAKIHHTLTGLHTRGLVTVTPISPRRYRPVPFGHYLERLRNEHRERILDLERREDELSRLLCVRGDAMVDEGGDVIVIRGRRTFLEKARQACRDARAEVAILASRGFTRRVLQKDVLETARRGVRVRLLGRAGALEEAALREFLPWCEVRLEPAAPEDDSAVGFAIVDDARAVVNHFVPDNGSASEGSDVGLEVTETGLVVTLRVSFDARWALARPLGAAPRPEDPPPEAL